ncbi:hypothetical protein D3C76_850250 [compost metagenome]
MLEQQRVEQPVADQVLRQAQFEPVAQHQGVFDVAAQPLPGRIVQPALLGFGQQGEAVVLQQQTNARQILGNGQAIHGVEHVHLGDAGAEGVGGDAAVVHVRAQFGMAQR